jgi:hypothetical protein
VIYVDSSVALAHLLVEDRRLPPALWTEPLIASRLLEYEVWCRLHAHALAASHGAAARELLARVSMVELSPLVLARALEPFPSGVHRVPARLPATAAACELRRTDAAGRTGDGN